MLPQLLAQQHLWPQQHLVPSLCVLLRPLLPPMPLAPPDLLLELPTLLGVMAPHLPRRMLPLMLLMHPVHIPQPHQLQPHGHSSQQQHLHSTALLRPTVMHRQHNTMVMLLTAMDMATLMVMGTTATLRDMATAMRLMGMLLLTIPATQPHHGPTAMLPLPSSTLLQQLTGLPTPWPLRLRLPAPPLRLP
mmetsp:Transcript_36914/g.82091  ORF Transcript_36914/g.82091 Transcript_36914/m.82091 type:complete len:190 (-) Transcript_36914:1196-1765(-)